MALRLIRADEFSDVTISDTLSDLSKVSMVDASVSSWNLCVDVPVDTG